MKHACMLAAIIVLTFNPDVSRAQTLPYEISIIVDDGVGAGLESYLGAAIARSASEAGIRASIGEQRSALFRSDVRIETISQTAVRTPAAQMVVELQVIVQTSQVQTGRSHGLAYVLSKGTGRNASIAEMNALRGNSTLNSDMNAYFRNVANDIAAYFDGACTGLLTNVNREVTLGNHDSAIFALGQIPMSAADCWARAQPVHDELVSELVSLQCSSYLIRARAQWAASRSRSSAREVADRLVAFYPGSSCDDEVDAILKDVTSVIAAYDSQAARRIEEDRRFRKSMYFDALADRRADAAREYSLDERRIEAQKEVGIEMARSWAKADVSWVTVFEN